MAYSVPDKLDHDRVAKRLQSDIDVLENGACLALFGSWGRGKTDVLERLKQLLQLPGFHVVDANPWKSGHTSVLATIASALASEKTVDTHTAESLLRISKAGFMLTNRFVLQKISGVNFEDLARDLGEIYKDGEKPISPIQSLICNVDKLINDCFPKGKVVVLIDDIDRCPPEWQRSVMESLYFLKLCNSNVIFVCALDQRSMIEAGLVTSDLDEVSSLCAKVFDIVHELHDPEGGLVDFGVDLLSKADRVIGDSLENRLRSIVKSWSDNDTARWIVEGMCLHIELSTPRTVERCVARLRAICLAIEKDDSVELASEWSAKGFGFALAMHDRFPSISREIFYELPTLIRKRNRSSSTDRHLVENYIKYINNLKKVHSDTIFYALGRVGVTVDAERMSNHEIGSMFSHGMISAGKLCKTAIV